MAIHPSHEWNVLNPYLLLSPLHLLFFYTLKSILEHLGCCALKPRNFLRNKVTERWHSTHLLTICNKLCYKNICEIWNRVDTFLILDSPLIWSAIFCKNNTSHIASHKHLRPVFVYVTSIATNDIDYLVKIRYNTCSTTSMAVGYS